MKKRVFLRLTSLLFLPLLFILPAGCNDVEPEPNSRIFYGCFDTVSVIYDYSNMEEDEFSRLSKNIEAAANHYHKLFDAYTEYDGINNIATLNRLAGKGKVEVDRAIIELLLFSRKMYDKTDGAVNFALGSVTYLWKTLPSSEEKRIPTDIELTEAGKHTNPDSVIIDTEGGTVEITDSLLRIDVGAIAKGYIAELIKKELKELGHSGIFLDFGGNLCAVGSKPDGKAWEGAIRNPLYPDSSNEPYVRETTILDDSLVTSGVYERYFIINGVRYHHIINPKTMKPENSYLSVSVQTTDSGVADALSTAIFNMDFDTAEKFVIYYEEKIEVTLVFPDGSCKVISSLV